MATSLLGVCTAPLFVRPAPPAHPRGGSGATATLLLPRRLLRPAVAAAAYKVTIEHAGATRTVDVGEDETILERALEEGVEVPHDCKLGVCMTCPAHLVSGEVDQGESMLAPGFAMLCASYPRSDCRIKTISEEERLSLQIVAADD